MLIVFSLLFTLPNSFCCALDKLLRLNVLLLLTLLFLLKCQQSNLTYITANTVQIYLVLLYYHQGIHTVGAVDFITFSCRVLHLFLFLLLCDYLLLQNMLRGQEKGILSVHYKMKCLWNLLQTFTQDLLGHQDPLLLWAVFDTMSYFHSEIELARTCKYFFKFTPQCIQGFICFLLFTNRGMQL